jgi:hypothetical protein
MNGGKEECMLDTGGEYRRKRPLERPRLLLIG